MSVECLVLAMYKEMCIFTKCPITQQPCKILTNAMWQVIKLFEFYNFSFYEILCASHGLTIKAESLVFLPQKLLFLGAWNKTAFPSQIQLFLLTSKL